MILCGFCLNGQHDECAEAPHGNALHDENYYHWDVTCDCWCPKATAAREIVMPPHSPRTI